MLSLEDSLQAHMTAAKAKDPQSAAEVLVEYEIDTFADLLKVPNGDMLHTLFHCGIEPLSAASIKKYCADFKAERSEMTPLPPPHTPIFPSLPHASIT
jgi:hypothetical protein